jgi:hypothetical protein
LQALFSERTPQDSHYDQAAGNQWNLGYKACAGTDTAMGKTPNLDIVQAYQKAMEWNDAQDRAAAIAKCMIALDNEIKTVETEGARKLDMGAYQLSKMSTIIHNGREGMLRRTWFGAVNLPLDMPSGQSMDAIQAFPIVNPTAAFTYRRKTMSLDKNGAKNVLEMLRYSYDSNAWGQDCWPTPAQVAECIRVQTQQHTEQRAHKQPNNITKTIAQPPIPSHTHAQEQSAKPRKRARQIAQDDEDAGSDSWEAGAEGEPAAQRPLPEAVEGGNNLVEESAPEAEAEGEPAAQRPVPEGLEGGGNVMEESAPEAEAEGEPAAERPPPEAVEGGGNLFEDSAPADDSDISV